MISPRQYFLLMLLLIPVGCGRPGAAYVRPDALYEQATELADDGRHLAAARSLEQFARDFPHDERAHVAQYNSGIEYRAAGEPARAFRAFRILRRRFEYSWLIPDANEHVLEIGRELLEAGDRLGLDALEFVITSARRSAAAVEAHLALGEYYYERGRFADARHEFATVGAEYPNHEKALYAEFRAALCAYRQIGRPVRNMQHLREARVRFQELVESDLEPRQRELAERYLKATAELGADRHLDMARFHLKQGRLPRARAHLEEVIRRYPEAGERVAAAQEVLELIQNRYNKEE